MEIIVKQSFSFKVHVFWMDFIKWVVDLNNISCTLYWAKRYTVQTIIAGCIQVLLFSYFMKLYQLMKLGSIKLSMFHTVFKCCVWCISHIAVDGRMIMKEELVRMWKEVLIASFEVLSQHLPVGSEEIFRKFQSGLLFTGPSFEAGKLQRIIEFYMVIRLWAMNWREVGENNCFIPDIFFKKLETVVSYI
jgi:hypothetical protein